MLAEVTSMQLYCMQLARLVIAEARDMLGGNGILLENHVIRHMGDIEVIHAYEGTETMQTLIVGRDITGVSAFA
jgi:glutaryl-CoA dehydrogenase